MTQITDASGAVQRFHYDRFQRLSSYTNANGDTAQFSYHSPSGYFTGSRGYEGTQYGIEYEEQCQDGFRYWVVQRLRFPDGSEQRLEHDAKGNLTGFTDRAGNHWRITCNERGQLVTSTNPVGGTARFTYNPDGTRARVESAAGVAESLEYDGLKRLGRVRDADGGERRYAYDEVDHLVTITNENGSTFTATFDARDRVASFADAFGNQYQFTYDANGRLVRTTDPEGHTITYALDQAGQLARLTNGAGESVQFAYDASGRRTRVFDALGTRLQFAYDAAGNLSQVETPLGTTTIEWNRAGLPTRRVMADNRSVTFTYDAQGQLTATDGLMLAYDKHGSLIASNGIQIERDGALRIRSLRLTAGKQVSYDYDQRGRVVKVMDWAGAETTLSYDADDRLTAIHRPNGVTTEITYDDNGRLVQQVETNGTELASIHLVRDAAGQITSAERNLPVEVLPAPGVLPVSYDAAQQMNGATYDGLGNRISRTAAGVREDYVPNYALLWAPVSIVRSGGEDQRYYVHLPNGILLYSIQAADNRRKFYHFDEMGNTILLTDDAGSVTDAYAVTPFGEQVNHPGPSTQPFVYHGAYGVMREAGTDLYYRRARYYDGGGARFLSRDPAMTLDPLAANPYQFVGDNPLYHIDPGGRTSLRCGASGYTQPGLAGPDPLPLWQFPLDDPGGFLRGSTDLPTAPFPVFGNSLDAWVTSGLAVRAPELPAG